MMEVIMLRKTPKPSFLISAELHSRIVNNCKPINLIDSRILDIRPIKAGLKKEHQSESVKNDFACCFASH